MFGPIDGPRRHVVLASLLRGLGRQPGHFRPRGANTGAPLLQHPFQLANERESVLQKHDFLRAGSGRALGRTCGSHHAWSPRYGLCLPATRLSFGRRFRFKASAGRRDRMTGRPAVRATAPSCGGARAEFPLRLFPTISPEPRRQGSFVAPLVRIHHKELPGFGCRAPGAKVQDKAQLLH